MTITESVLFEALPQEKIDLRPGRVYDVAKVRTAITVVQKMLGSHEQPDALVEERIKFSKPTSVALVLVITTKQ